jgi:hypothetical protein
MKEKTNQLLLLLIVALAAIMFGYTFVQNLY